MDPSPVTYGCGKLGTMPDKRLGSIRYRLVVRGELDERYASLFDGMSLERVQGSTVITGDVVDQAHLHGVIERIEELGLELFEIQRVGSAG